MDLTKSELERYERALGELHRRKMDALRLFRALPHQEKFFSSTASELLLKGGNRAGKTMCAAAMCASAATGIPVLDYDGKPFPYTFPTDRPLLIWLVGYGAAHIGDTFHRMLFKPNPELKMIRDAQTGEFRPYRPWDPGDVKRKKEATMMPPLIPTRMIAEDGWAWESKGINHFSQVTLKPRPEFGDEYSQGTVIKAWTSKGEPKMGDPVDLIWIDERIAYSRHYSEWQARISDRKGRIIWSLWPGHANDAIWDIVKRAKDQEDRKRPDVEVVTLSFSENPFIDAEEKRKRLESWDDATRKSRDQGELVSGKSRVYPNFNKIIHMTPSQSPDTDDEIDKAIRENGGRVPGHWRKDLILDPGHSHPGVLFVAIPPTSGKIRKTVGVVYDEIYLPNSSAEQIAIEICKKNRGVFLQSMICDVNAGRQTPMGFSKTIAQNYSEKFGEKGIRCVQTSNHFVWGSDDLLAGLEAVREYLTLMYNGRPRLRYIEGSCPYFAHQMEIYRKGQDGHGHTVDKPAPRQVDPLCDCIRYWAAASLEYLPPPHGQKAEPSPQYKYFKQQWETREKKKGSIHLGPGAANV